MAPAQRLPTPLSVGGGNILRLKTCNVSWRSALCSCHCRASAPLAKSTVLSSGPRLRQSDLRRSSIGSPVLAAGLAERTLAAAGRTPADARFAPASVQTAQASAEGTLMSVERTLACAERTPVCGQAASACAEGLHATQDRLHRMQEHLH